MNSSEDDQKYIRLLEEYIDQLKAKSLPIEKRMNLVHFYIQDPDNYIKEKTSENDFTSLDLERYAALGWIMCNTQFYMNSL